MQKYQIISKKGEGTFSEVLRAEDTATHRIVAIKYMKKSSKTKEEVNSLREIQSARRLQPHPNIVSLHEVLYDRSTGRLALVMEMLQMSLYDLIKNRRQYLSDERIMNFMYQLLKGLNHAHSRGLFHRDIKPENILLNADDTLKIADFGSCKGVYSKQPFTEYISTRWYRSPECLLTDGYYNYKMDVWSAGCVFFEMSSLYPLFPGSNELDQLHKIHNVLGTPSPELLDRMRSKGAHFDIDFPVKQGIGLEKLLPNASRDAIDLMSKLLTYDEERRYTMKEALRHPYFSSLREAERQASKAQQQQQQEAVPQAKQNHVCDTAETVPLSPTAQMSKSATHAAPTSSSAADIVSPCADTTSTTSPTAVDAAPATSATVPTTRVMDAKHKATPPRHDSTPRSHQRVCPNRALDEQDDCDVLLRRCGRGDCNADSPTPATKTFHGGEATKRAAVQEKSDIAESESAAAEVKVCSHDQTTEPTLEKTIGTVATGVNGRPTDTAKRDRATLCPLPPAMSRSPVKGHGCNEAAIACTPHHSDRLPSIEHGSSMANVSPAATALVSDDAAPAQMTTTNDGRSKMSRKTSLVSQLSPAGGGKRRLLVFPSSCR